MTGYLASDAREICIYQRIGEPLKRINFSLLILLDETSIQRNRKQKVRKMFPGLGVCCTFKRNALLCCEKKRNC